MCAHLYNNAGNGSHGYNRGPRRIRCAKSGCQRQWVVHHWPVLHTQWTDSFFQTAEGRHAPFRCRNVRNSHPDRVLGNNLPYILTTPHPARLARYPLRSQPRRHGGRHNAMFTTQLEEYQCITNSTCGRRVAAESAPSLQPRGAQSAGHPCNQRGPWQRRRSSCRKRNGELTNRPSMSGH